MKERISVAMVILEYHPIVGGAQQQLKMLAPLLREQGIDLTVVTRRYPGLEARTTIEGTPVMRLPAPGPKAVASLSYTTTAVAQLRRLKPDLIHAYSFLSPLTIAVLAKRLLNIPTVVKILRGGHLGDVARLQRRSTSERRIEQYRRYIDRFIVISDEIRNELNSIDIPSQQQVFIPNGVDTQRFSPLTAAEKVAQRQAHRLSETAPTAVFAGRLAAEKRIDDILAIWPQVRQTHPEATLLVLGNGPEEAKLKQAAGDGIQFLGRVDNVEKYLQMSDLFILPSSTEGLSNSMLEGLATGTAVLATDVGGAPDIINHGKNGWLFAPGDQQALQEGAITLFSQPKLRAEMGEKARQYIVDNYELNVIARKMRQMYADVLQR